MGLSPWQMLLWIAGLELISVPILIFVANAISVGWFRAKEQHMAKMMSAFGKFLEEIGGKIEGYSKKEETK